MIEDSCRKRKEEVCSEVTWLLVVSGSCWNVEEEERWLAEACWTMVAADQLFLYKSQERKKMKNIFLL